MLTNQKRAQRKCECGRAYVYTDHRPGTPQSQCTECNFDEIMAEALGQFAVHNNLNRRAN